MGSLNDHIAAAVAGTGSINDKMLAIFARFTAQDAIADASEAHALNAVFDDTEVEAALNALGVKVNAIIAALVAAGLLEESA